MPTSETAEEKAILEKGETEFDLLKSLKEIGNDVTQQSKRLTSNYAKDLGEYIAALKTEAVEAFNIQEQNFLAQTGEVTEQLKKEVGNVVTVIEESFGFVIDDADDNDRKFGMKGEVPALDSDFFTSDHSTDEHWSRFKASKAIQMNEIQKSAILSNDTALNDLFKELVPAFIAEVAFWESWQYHRFLVKLEEKPAKTLIVQKKSWTDWEDSALSAEANATDIHKIKTSLDPKRAEEDWEEWE